MTAATPKPGEGLSKLTREEWDALCRHCGSCCFEKHTDERGVHHMTRIACRFLDVVSRECRVYHKRLDTGELCLQLNPGVVSKADWLPDDCAYRVLLAQHPDVQVAECSASNSSNQTLVARPLPPE